MKAANVYQTLLRPYPRDHRALFADEMVYAFTEAAGEKRGPAYLRFALGEFTGLVIGAGSEWIAKFSTDPSIRGRTLPDRVKMRPTGVPWETHYAAAFTGARPDEIVEAQRRREALVGRMVHAIANHDFEGARTYSNLERDARETLRVLREKHGVVE
jgi:hypothetical protein